MKFVNIAILAIAASASAARERAGASGRQAGLRHDLSDQIPVGCIPNVPGIVATGEACTLGCECTTGRCDAESYFSTKRTCMETVAIGEPCNENSDCLSNKCPWAFRMVCALKANGEPCGSDATLFMNPATSAGPLSALCESGRCEFDSMTDLFGKCAPKLADGESCDKNEDCESGACQRARFSINSTCTASSLRKDTETAALV